jgi:hypothetical protein
LLHAVFQFYGPQRLENETLGYCIRRVGVQPLIDHLSCSADMADLLVPRASADNYLDAASANNSAQR